MVSVLAMLLVPVGAEAADKMVQIFDSENGAVADVSPDGALEVGDDRGPLTVDGSVNVEPGTEPIMIDGAVEIDEESQPIAVEGSSIPGIPENPIHVTVTNATEEATYLEATPFVALTSITATNLNDHQVTVLIDGMYQGMNGGDVCTGPGAPQYRLTVQPLSTLHVELPTPLLFRTDEVIALDCPSGVPPTHSGFVVNQVGETPHATVHLIGYQG